MLTVRQGLISRASDAARSYTGASAYRAAHEGTEALGHLGTRIKAIKLRSDTTEQLMIALVTLAAPLAETVSIAQCKVLGTGKSVSTFTSINPTVRGQYEQVSHVLREAQETMTLLIKLLVQANSLQKKGGESIKEIINTLKDSSYAESISLDVAPSEHVKALALEVQALL